MESSIPSLTYKGTIPEAIHEAQKQKKLFVVYISGVDAESAELEKSTWSDSKVVDSLSKYCILLHIPEGSNDATNFRAIYPQKSVPSIAAIGYNGIQVWHNEGFVSAEDLASSLEKAWLSLHLHETTASVLTAALASKKPGQSTSGSSDIGSFEQGNSSGTDVPSSLMDKDIEFTEAKPLAVSETVDENNSREDEVEGTITNLHDQPTSESLDASKSLSIQDKQSLSRIEEVKGLASKDAQAKTFENHSGVTERDSQLTTSETEEAMQDEKGKLVNDRKADTLDTNTRANMSNDVHLNIRLPNGGSLQEKFSVTSTLGMVKDYVDRNQTSGIGSYDLAIPYPRKVFGDQDLSKLLSELSLFNRQALIVVPRQRATSYSRARSSASDQTTTTNTNSSNMNDGGYFAYIKRMLSYVNPLSYLTGGASSSSPGQSQSSMWEYSPNPNSRHSPSQSTSTSSRNDGNSRQPTTSRFGSNIHTLKHDEDDEKFNDRNAFWNGNSTQYGGNNDK